MTNPHDVQDLTEEVSRKKIQRNPVFQNDMFVCLIKFKLYKDLAGIQRYARYSPEFISPEFLMIKEEQKALSE